MIRQLAQCPYCNRCEIALDDAFDVACNPGAADAGPCPHLIWADGRYSQWGSSTLPGRKTKISRIIGSTEFRWNHPGLSEVPEFDRLMQYLKDLADSGKTWEFAPVVAFEVSQLSSDEKEKGPDGKEYVVWDVDGQALFAQDAAAFVAVLPACLDKLSTSWEMPTGQ